MGCRTYLVSMLYKQTVNIGCLSHTGSVLVKTAALIVADVVHGDHLVIRAPYNCVRQRRCH